MNIDVKKWNPWNWFQDESNKEGQAVPQRMEKVGERSRELAKDYVQDPLVNMHREMDRMFDNMLRQFNTGLPSFDWERGPLSRFSGSILKPSVDIKEDKKNYTITVEVPGVNEEDVRLELQNNNLVIQGEKKSEEKQEEETYHSIERTYGSFKRILTLPEDCDQENIEAKFKDGVLSITIPRKEISKPEGSKVIDIKRAA
jgi:HSP20 family protein